MTNTKGLVLIIEDDKSILNFLGISMKTNGYSYDIAETGLTGISLFMTNKPDLILLDLGLPDKMCIRDRPYPGPWPYWSVRFHL